jgi:hypothetical protein
MIFLLPLVAANPIVAQSAVFVKLFLSIPERFLKKRRRPGGD